MAASTGETRAAGPGWEAGGPSAGDAARCERVRAALDAAGYTDEGITRALGADHLSHLRDRRLAVLLHRTRGGTPLETLIRVFLLGQPVEAAEFARAVAPGTIEDWLGLGLLEAAGTAVRAAVQLRCYQGLVVAWDFARLGPGGVRPDYVMGVSPSSLVLLAMTVRRPARAALDLGAGCGIQALMAARHCERVIGVDCNPRAVAMARFNACFNRIANAEFRLGDMFAPVAGEHFDLIVSNPPFIISPDFRHMFLNSGSENDDVCRRIVREAPAYLSDGGFAILNANWAVLEGEDWKARLAGWFAGNGCDGLVLQQEMAAPDRYAAIVIQAGEQAPEEFDRAFAAWMEYYAQRRLKAIGGGVIAMRRAAGRANWFAVEPGPVDFAVASGADIERLFGLRTWLQTVDENGFLEARLKLAEGVVLDQTCQAEAGVWRPAVLRLRRVGGIGFGGTVDAPGAALLARCDGTQTVREHLRALAAMLHSDTANITPGAIAILRRLVEQGFLEPA